MNEQSITEKAQGILRFRLKAVAAVFRNDFLTPVTQERDLEEHIKHGVAELAALLREPVDVAALAVGTTFRAPHINVNPDQDRLWVRTEGGITDLTLNRGSRYETTAADPKKVHAVQPPAAEDAE